MIHWAFAVVTLGAAATATFIGGIRQSILALWIAGLAIGGFYLTIGVEFLAVVQWIVSTLVAISFFFFAVMFGEYDAPSPPLSGRSLARLVLPVALGAAFAAIIGFTAGDLSEDLLTIPTQANDLQALGKAITQEHFLSLEVLSLTLFLVLVGGGVIARPDRKGGGRG